MCIIAIKPQGKQFPDDETMRTMFAHNPHGAGFMFPYNGRVEIRKGFMDYGSFAQALRNVRDRLGDDIPVVMHFRITTHGGTCPGNTHPFPLTDDIADMHRTTSHATIGVAHNGIIRITPRSADVSDTMEFIASVLAPIARKNPRFYETQRICNGIRDSINGSRMVFLTGKGEIVRIGAWIEHDGCFYSNDSFKPNDTRWLAHAPVTPVAKTPGRAYTGPRLPWEGKSRLFVKIMPLKSGETYRDTDGALWSGALGVDGFGRLYELDPEEGVAYEAETYLDDPVRYDKHKAIYFEVA